MEAAESEAKEATAERDAREKAELTRALGLESDGKIPAALRAQIRQLEEDQKRRAKRARTDVLDRAGRFWGGCFILVSMSTII